MNRIDWKPFPGPQEIFHQSAAYEVLFGGAKGPGKTESLLREASRQIDNPNYRAVIFRRTYPRLGEVRDRSFKYYKGMGATYSGDDRVLGLPAWTWPSGAKIAFSHCQREEDKWNHHGKEWHFMGFDEVAEFTERQYLFLLAQNRTSDATIRCYVRSTANPGGVGHAWVKRRFIEACTPNKIKYFKRVNDEDIECDKNDPASLSRSFIPANVYDNPALLKNDPGYIRRLEALSDVDKRAFLYGDWDVFAGQFFKMWRNAFHVKHLFIPHYARRFCSLDYGYGSFSSVGWWALWDEGGRLKMHRYREFYKSEMTYEALAKEIKERSENERIDYLVADPSIWNDRERHREGISGESGAETMQRIFSGWTGVIKGDNSRLTGWGRMRIMLEPNQGQADLTCDPSCKDSIRTIPSLVHDENRVEDLDTTGEDHCADDWRYALMSRPMGTSAPKPKSEDPAMPMAIELISNDEEKSEYQKWLN